MSKYSDIVASALRVPTSNIGIAENESARAEMLRGYAELAKAEQMRITNLIQLMSNQDINVESRQRLLDELFRSII